MNTSDPSGDEARLGRLLREARTAPALPPRFQENVWRRIEDAESPDSAFAWLESLISQLLRPRFALAALTVLILTGTMLGTHAGKQAVRQTQQARYLASVAPDTLH